MVLAPTSAAEGRVGLELVEVVAGQLVVRREFHCIGKLGLRVVAGAGHQVVIRQQEMVGCRFGIVRRRLFQGPQLDRVLFDFQVASAAV